MKSNLLLLLLAFAPSVHSQADSDTIKSSRIIVTTSVIEWLPSIRFFTGNFNVGMGIYLGDRNELYVNSGVIRPYGPSHGIPYLEALGTYGFKLQIEVRRFIGKHKLFEPAILVFWPHIFQYKTRVLPNTGYYMAVHTHFQRTITVRQETVLDYIDNNPNPDTEHFKTNNYNVERDVAALHLKFGYQCIKRRGLTVDYGVGLGMQFISSRSANRIGGSRANNDLDWGGKAFDFGQSMFASAIYQVRVGWAIGRK
jgi:hypothetical protein